MRRIGTRIVLVADPAEAARLLADEIEALVRERHSARKAAVLGLATGRTPVALYDELALRVARGRLDLSDAVAFNLDEYCGLAPGDSRSFAAWMRAHLFERVGWPPARTRIPPAHVAPSERAHRCEEFEAAIRAAGGIDLQVLGIGRNGHIGFNEPESPRLSRTRVVELDRTTREDAAQAFGAIDAVPRLAVTMGVATILDARRVRLLAFGEQKREALARAWTGPVGADSPASFLREHGDLVLFADAAALGSLATTAEPA